MQCMVSNVQICGLTSIMYYISCAADSLVIVFCTYMQHTINTMAISLCPADETTTQPRQDINIRTILIISVSVVAGIIWIAVCCLCACVIVCQRMKSKDQYVTSPQSSI